jgi:tRNA(adenine34) deaminase
MNDKDFMLLALKEAEQAAAEGEVPVGAVLEYDGTVLAAEHNRMIQSKNPIAHAELLTMQQAMRAHPEKWLLETTLYVTLEPCAMCAGAMVLSRVKRLVFATRDPKAGAAGSIMDLVQSAQLNHRLQVDESLMRAESSKLLSDFFAKLRRK